MAPAGVGGRAGLIVLIVGAVAAVRIACGTERWQEHKQELNQLWASESQSST